MSTPTPPVVPPMSPTLRERLYGIWGWIGAALFLIGLVIAGITVTAASMGLNIELPAAVLLVYGVAVYVTQNVGTWLNFVAKANVPDTGHPASGDPDLEDVG